MKSIIGNIIGKWKVSENISYLSHRISDLIFYVSRICIIAIVHIRSYVSRWVTRNGLSNFSRVPLVRMTAARFAWKFRGIRRHAFAGERGWCIRCKYSRETLGWLWPGTAAFVRVGAAGIDSCLEGGFFHQPAITFYSQIWRRLTTFLLRPETCPRKLLATIELLSHRFLSFLVRETRENCHTRVPFFIRNERKNTYLPSKSPFCFGPVRSRSRINYFTLITLRTV